VGGGTKGAIIPNFEPPNSGKYIPIIPEKKTGFLNLKSQLTVGTLKINLEVIKSMKGYFFF
jgi:hypothetical protein